MTAQKAPPAPERKAALQAAATPTAAVVAPGQSPFAALAAMSAKFVADAPATDEDLWSEPREVGKGLFCQVSDGMLIMAVPISEAARAKARPSNTGALCLLANSGGFKALDGLGLKISVNVGFPNPTAPRKGVGSK